MFVRILKTLIFKSTLYKTLKIISNPEKELIRQRQANKEKKMISKKEDEGQKVQRIAKIHHKDKEITKVQQKRSFGKHTNLSFAEE